MNKRYQERIEIFAIKKERDWVCHNKKIKKQNQASYMPSGGMKPADHMYRCDVILGQVNQPDNINKVKDSFQGSSRHTLMTQSFLTDKSGQKLQTQIRLLLEEQSDQGLHCLLFHLHVFDKIPSGLASLFEF